MAMDKRRREGPVPEGDLYPIADLTAWRRVAAINIARLASEAGVSVAMLSLVIRGKSRIRGATVNRLARVLCVPASVLVRVGPYTEEGKPWARKAAMAGALRRLTPAS